MEQERGKIKYMTGLKVRNITLDDESMKDYKQSFDYIHEELVKFMKYLANEYIPTKKSFFYESKNFYLALTPVEPDFDDVEFFKERRKNYRTQIEFMKCVNYMEKERLKNTNYYLYLFYIEYYFAPFAYNNTLLKNNTSPVIELKLLDTVTGKFMAMSDCEGDNQIKFTVPFSGYYYLDEFNSQKKFYDPNVYKSPDDPIFKDPIYILDNGNVTGITVEELKKEYYRRMNITPKYYDDLLEQYIDIGVRYINFTNDTNYLIFTSSHLTKFTSFFVPNNATFKTNNRFFYLKRPRILKFFPNYSKSWGWWLYIALHLVYLIFLVILSVYDSTSRNQEALLEYIKEEVINFSLHYKKDEDKNNYIPNIFRNKYNFRNFEEVRTTNAKLATIATTNDDFKSTRGNFWKNEKKSEMNVGSDGEPIDDFDLIEEDDVDVKDKKPVVKNNFFYLGEVKQKKLTIEDKLKRKNNNNTFMYNRKKILKDIRKNKLRPINNGTNNINSENNRYNPNPEFEKEDEAKHQILEDFASIDLTFFEFLLKNIISRSILINSFIIVSIFSPRWKKQTLLFTEMCLIIIFSSIFLTNDETVRTGAEIVKIVIYSLIIMVLTDFFMYIFSFLFFSFPNRVQRKLYNLVINNDQLKILKEWGETENRMRKLEFIGICLCILIWLFTFYISFGFTVVWTIQREAFLICFAMCFAFDFIGGELLIELLIAILYLERKHNSFLRYCAEGLNNLRNIRCLSP
jgi:hypothetical protein